MLELLGQRLGELAVILHVLSVAVAAPAVYEVLPPSRAGVVSVSSTKEYQLERIEKHICLVFGSECRVALAVSRAENQTRQCDIFVDEPNGSLSIGLFQINSVHFNKYPPKRLTDCFENINIAKRIYDTAKGWSPWSAYKNGSYKKFLKESPL